MSTTKTRRFRVAGVSFIDSYPANLHRLAKAIDTATFHGEPLPVVLRRNPDNPHDRNAIEVHVPALGDDAMVGHVPKDQARHLAPQMDNGTVVGCSVYGVAIDPAHPDRPGLECSMWIEAS